MTAFDEIRFPTAISLKAAGGPERRTEIVTTGVGPRGAQRALGPFAPALQCGLRREVARRHPCGHRFLRGAARPAAWLPLEGSCRFQILRAAGECERDGSGDRHRRWCDAAFQLVKRYGTGLRDYVRRITKPVAGTVRVAVDGIEKTAGTHFTVDHATGHRDLSRRAYSGRPARP